MKSALYLTFGLLILSVLALRGWKIVHEAAAPPAKPVQDMDHRPRHAYRPPPAGAVPFSEPGTRSPRANGESLFLLHCATCHGAAGNGQSFVAQQPGMPDVSDLTTTTSTPEELYRTLSEGRGAMPAFAPRLNDAHRRLLIQHIRTLHQP